MQSQDNKAIVQRFLEAVFNDESYEVASEVVDTSFVYYDPNASADGKLQGLDEVKRLLDNFRARYPNLSITIEELIDAEEDRVVARYVMYGTHRGIDKQVTAQGIGIGRISDGKLQEIQVDWDTAGWLVQEVGGPAIGESGRNAFRCWWWWCW